MPRSINELKLAEILMHMNNLLDSKQFDEAERFGNYELQHNSRLSDSDRSEINNCLDRASILSSQYFLETNPELFDDTETPFLSPSSP